MPLPKTSAFDVLMSAARAGAKKEPQSSSPQKRKSPDSYSTQTSKILKSTEITCQSSGPSNDTECTDIKDSKKGPEPAKEDLGSGVMTVVSVKRMRVVDFPEKITELKRKVSLLKRKPADFDPCSISCWGKGEPVPFLFLSLVFDMIEPEKERNVIIDIMCNTLRTVMHTTPDDLVAVVYLSARKIAPAYEGLELGIGEASIIKALAEACGRTEVQIKNQLIPDKSDLGLVAKASRSSQSMLRKPDPLTIGKVFNTFRLIAKESGKDSQEKKKNHIKGLLVAATDCEPKYLIRLLQSELQIGSAEQTLLSALGQAALYTEGHSIPPPEIQSPLAEAAKIVKQVYSVLPVYDKIIPSLLAGGVWKLPETCNFTLGIPVGPMLAKPIKSISKVLNKFQAVNFTCEYKYDGQRAQIHYMDNGSVEIYSRNGERNTGKYPDVVATISRLKKSPVSSFVLDCELVAYNREKKKILPFQVLGTRARKNVSLSDIKVDVCIFAFDILYLNGKPLLQEILKIRREHLYASFEEEPGFLQFATAITSNDVEEVQMFLDAAVDASCEGLIIKTLYEDATYEPSKRSHKWLKLKKDYLDNLGDSLDLVPIAAFHGQGKRAGIYGAFLVACYDSNNEEFQSICNIGTGFSDARLKELYTRLRSKVIPKPKPYYRYPEKINPDECVWFEASEVWEVKAADLLISPVHRAAVGMVDSDKGISLRLPRFLRVRHDKAPEEATSPEMVAEMYSAQDHSQLNNQVDDDGEEEEEEE